MSRLAATALATCAFAAAAVPLAAQSRFVFTLDPNLSSFTFSGSTTLGPIVGQPNTFKASGGVELDLQIGGGAVTNGRFVPGSSAAVIPTLNAIVPNPITPLLPPLATMTVTGVLAEFTSPAFAVAGGSFSTQVTATMLSGNANVTALGQNFSIPLTGNQSTPAPISGTISHGTGGFLLNVPLSGTFAFVEPNTGISGSLTIAGTVRGDDQALSPDTLQISLGTGGSQKLTLSAGSTHANGVYLLLGSASGTQPGLNIGGVSLPLNPDSWLVTSALNANSGPFVNTAGTLSSLGVGNASITFPPLNIPVLFGLPFDHAYLVLSGTTAVFGSNAVPMTLTP